MLDITILQGSVPGNEHQEAAACLRLEDKICSRCGVLSLIVRKTYAGCDERNSLMRTRSDGRMHRMPCNPSCVGSFFGTKVKLLDGMGS